MPLTREQKLSLLNRAIQLESRSFLEYIALTAPPVDIEKHPAVAQTLREIAHEEDQVVDDLVEMVAELGAHPDRLRTYDLTFTQYNYVTTRYALKVIAEQMRKALMQFDEIVAAAKGDPLEERLQEVRQRKMRQLARLDDLGLQSLVPTAAPAPPPVPHAAGH